jgi:hypothetical protein
MSDADLMDPKQAEPAPPFPKQHQDAPAIEAQMDPRPDYGEKSYKGSGKLTGRCALHVHSPASVATPQIRYSAIRRTRIGRHFGETPRCEAPSAVHTVCDNRALPPLLRSAK